ncbi:heterogeneous nuclear ribonucleoprotein Q isoform X2 [Malania oleifera]|uniref:heterogeneous nuclear ribonucleoprotein Q isoform X2 n=1 Tax=Malania oleifera TaxID=397392 RepID=UPI0025ADA4E8|nr:heterogeneous nuclear ribonucleoprotein Q isoform X2 [Malania oleifera]
MAEDDEMKESLDEYEKGERLDLEDNEAEYEPEEDVGVDYDEKEIDQEDVQEEGDEGEEEVEEGDVADEEEADMVEEEMEDVLEEVEGEEDEEHVGEERAEMVDADEEEHHEVFKERRKRKEFEVFVGGLDKDATEDDLKKVFSEVGEVTEVRLMMNPQTKKNKGFAFLRFATVEQAKRAVTELKNPVVNGKQCGVTPSQDSDTLFLGNICKTWTKEALKEKLKHYGVESIEDLTLVEDSNNEGMNRGFAFLEFSSRSDAMDAFKRLQKRDVVFGVDRTAKVSFADSFIDPGDEIMAQVKTVFVDGLPASWDEDRVRELLKKYGEIEKIELARNMPSAKRKDFGFVTFDSHDAAVTCAKSINNAELGEGDNKAKVRARLSRPLQRGKGKHVGRGDFRPGRGAGRVVRGSWGRPVPRSLPVRGARGIGGRLPPAVDRGLKRPVSFRDRRPPLAVAARGRPLPPVSRSYDRRAPVPSYPRSSLKRDYARRDELTSRSRAAAEYGSRVVPERRSSYRDEYAARGSGYSDLPRSTSRTVGRRTYVDDGYGQRFERPPPSYREGRARDYDSISGSKRPYNAMDDVPPRYADASGRQSRARLDYELTGGSSQYGDTYGERLGRSNLGGYGSSRSSISSQEPHGLYGSRQGMGYSGGSFSGSDVGGMYSSSFSSDYMSRGNDVGGGSYSSLYSSRSMGGSSYMGSGGSGSYY